MVPPTPHGIYGILPDHLDASRIPSVKQVISTNLFSIVGDENSVDRAIARHPMLFRADGAFVGIQSFSDRRHRIYLVDPGHIDQRGVATKLEYQGQGRVGRVTDRLNGGAVSHEQSSVPVEVEPGLFRIFDIVIEKD